MEIRPLRSDEVDRLVDRLWVPLAREMEDLDEFNAVGDDARADAIEYHERGVIGDERTILVAVDDGEFVGFVYAKRGEAPPPFAREYNLHVVELFVRESYRQRGIASALLTEIEAWGRERGCDTATLLVHVDNDAANALYEDNGFERKRNFFAKSLR